MAMNRDKVLAQKVRVLAPWERAFDRFATPFERFINQETASGVLLLVFTAIALGLANSPLADVYHQVLHTPVRLSFGGAGIEKSLWDWVNEGLMALFFFVVGLEIKHELLVGNLSRPRQAVLPIIAALGGMVVPAAVFLLLVNETEAVRGWGIPMATDIAFAVAALGLLGSRIPRSVLAFLLVLAIVDDLGALVVIALFYSKSLNLTALLAAGGVFLMMLALNRFGLRRPWPYFVLALLLWLAMLESGVHATLAGVITAFAIPARPKYDPARFADLLAVLLQRYRSGFQKSEPVLHNEQARSALQTMEDAVLGVVPPLQRLEYKLLTPTALLVIPLFALTNAGIAVDARSIKTALA